jgi:hypothetical protein
VRITVLASHVGYVTARTARQFQRDKKDLEQKGFHKLISFNIPKRVRTPWPKLYRDILGRLISRYGL